MKNYLRTFAVVAGLALAMPMLAQRGMSPSITNGTHLGYPAASILTPNNQRFGDSAPRGTTRFGTFGGWTPQRSFIPQHGRRDHQHFRNNFSYPIVPYYPAYYDPYFYGGTYMEDNSSLPGAGTFYTEPQPETENVPRAYPTYRPYYESNSVIDSEGHIYDRRVQREPSPEVAESTQPRPAASANGGEENETRTVLVFKDGHQMEVANYAIMGSNLYLFAGDHRKIPLSDLDLDATVKVNEERGTDFRVPAPQNPS